MARLWRVSYIGGENTQNRMELEWSRTCTHDDATSYLDFMFEFSSHFMDAAYEEARKGSLEGGVPIGSVLVYDNRIIGRGRNRRVQEGSVILHGEMDALRNAGRQRPAVYRACTLYTTLSPCAMCSGAILLYGIPVVVIGENSTFTGEEALLLSRGVRLHHAKDQRCIHLMRTFIENHPELWYEDIGQEE